MGAHEDYLVDLVDEQGRVTGQKRRKDINKTTDLYHGIYVLIITPSGQLVLSKIPTRNDLPNLYANSWGTTLATMRRSNETASAAALRALATETFIQLEPDGLRHIGDHFVTLAPGRAAYISVYFVSHDMPLTFNTKDIEDIKAVSPEQLTTMLAESVTPTLAFIWNKYASAL